ncbi:hypothetical protein QJS04_geneDACA010784 [Acorus gramineus]|uniref:Uncharacterized protein n=1 Tax=Acorus gramineus TaxID=55184 RepID=A0AAV9BCW7_ACOGR|nr:hypothetical protein QJS04_geneDACA010784 [Acorus gramineus]
MSNTYKDTQKEGHQKKNIKPRLKCNTYIIYNLGIIGNGPGHAGPARGKKGLGPAHGPGPEQT